MEAFIATCPLGVFAYAEDGKLKAFELFPKNPEEIARKLVGFNRGETIPEVRKVFEKVSENFEVVVESDYLLDISASIEMPNPAGKTLRKELPELSEKYGFGSYKKLLNDLNFELTKKKLRNELARDDRKIMQVVEAIGELDDSLNVISERLREWYGLYYPEMSESVKTHENFANLVSKAKDRGDYQGKLKDMSRDSVGGEFGNKDIFEIRQFAESISNMYSMRERLEEYLEKVMRRAAPNLLTVAGATIGAKLISGAGGLTRLASMPSSTVQVLGAEKALFRHLKTGAKPPKYGFILHHSMVANAKSPDKGKVARVVAGSISIAARKDAYSKEDSGAQLKKELEKKVARIARK
jgi:nucleolar protein 56